MPKEGVVRITPQISCNLCSLFISKINLFNLSLGHQTTAAMEKNMEQTTYV